MRLSKPEVRVTELSLSYYISHLEGALKILKEKEEGECHDRIIQFENDLIESRKLLSKLRLSRRP